MRVKPVKATIIRIMNFVIPLPRRPNLRAPPPTSSILRTPKYLPVLTKMI